MTWQNLPCAPTLPALFAACPHGWAEIVADLGKATVEFDRTWFKD